MHLPVRGSSEPGLTPTVKRLEHEAVRFEVIGEANAGLLCRLIGLLAQQDLAAPEVQVRVTGGSMIAEIEIGDLPHRLGPILAEKMARCIGVEAVSLNGVPLASLGYEYARVMTDSS